MRALNQENIYVRITYQLSGSELFGLILLESKLVLNVRISFMDLRVKKLNYTKHMMNPVVYGPGSNFAVCRSCLISCVFLSDPSPIIGYACQ